MARIEVPMPQMGESIAEGTVSRWIKQLGEAVERDEPILEISTDKVDAEVPSPASGTLVAIAVQEGETVEVGTALAYIDPDGGAADAAHISATAGAKAIATESSAGTDAPMSFPTEASPAPAGTTGGSETSGTASQDSEGADDRMRSRSTPVVRRIAEEHGIDLGAVQGTGHAGRVTKSDILSHIAIGASREEFGPSPSGAEAPGVDVGGTMGAPSVSTAPAAPPVQRQPASGTGQGSEMWSTFYREVQHPEYPVRAADRVEPMDKIRRLTAEHMVLAKRVAPHVHSFIEVDFSAIDRIRAESKARWAAQGASVSYTAFVAWAVSRVLRDFPMVNAAVSGNNVIYRGNVNIGIAVDLNPGLIVPVVHDADHLGLVGIGNKIIDLAARARDRKLLPGDIQGATFSVTNPGVLGTLVGMPVIPKGTSAILGTGAIEKRVVVVTDPKTGTDSTAIRKRALFSLGYDHRIVDGADSARFLARLKETLENFPGDA